MLEFKENGTFTMSYVPNFWINLRDAGPKDQSEFDALGAWSLGMRNDKPVIYLTFDSINIQDFNETEIRLYFEGHLPPYRIIARGFNTLNPMFRFVKD